MTVTIKRSESEGSLAFNTDITEESALEMESAIDLLCGYYKFDHVVIEINSNGGQATALTHMTACIEAWRKRGCKVSTKATFRAGSAAALLLSMGEVGSRQVQPHTALLYHQARINPANAQITAGSANQIRTVLNVADQRMLNRLLEHQVIGYGGADRLAQEGLARCELLSERAKNVAKPTPGKAAQKERAWISTGVRVFGQCKEMGTFEPYRKHLARRFEQDDAMNVREAWALCLIDSISGVADLPSRVFCEQDVESASAPAMIRQAR